MFCDSIKGLLLPPLTRLAAMREAAGTRSFSWAGSSCETADRQNSVFPCRLHTTLTQTHSCNITTIVSLTTSNALTSFNGNWELLYQLWVKPLVLVLNWVLLIRLCDLLTTGFGCNHLQIPHWTLTADQICEIRIPWWRAGASITEDTLLALAVFVLASGLTILLQEAQSIYIATVADFSQGL